MPHQLTVEFERVEGLATQRIGNSTPLQVVDAILSGTHEPGTSHYNLLRAFAEYETLCRVDQQLNANDYRRHEFGDSIFIEKSNKRRSRRARPPGQVGMIESCEAVICEETPREGLFAGQEM
jgi:S-adenosylmethionine:tRNA ribosyltransferase-isomerase